MKQIIPLLLVVLFISSLKVQAITTTYYVNAATGLDTNTGTTVATAWATLNPSKWSGDCKIYIANGEYLITEKINVTVNVELIGTSKDLVSLMGSSDEEFPDDGRGGLTMTSGIFELPEGKTLKIEGLTMKNIRRDVGTEATFGGAIRTQTGSSLTFRDVNMRNCIVLNGGGGAIYANGNIDFENVTFENCSATSYGAALSLKDSLQNKAVYRLEKVHFLNNNSSSDIVYVQSPTTEFSLNNCLFKGNSRLSEYGAVLRLSSNSGYLNAKITNSSFVDNPGVKSGVISIPTNSANTRTIDLKIVNCTFTNNTLSQGPHGAVYSMGGSSTTTLTGTIAFVNNTIFNNGRANDVTGTTSCLYFPDTRVDFFFVNNIVLQKENKGNGLYLNSQGYCTPTIKGNIIEPYSVGGITSVLTALAKGSDNIVTGQKADATKTPPVPYISGNVAVKLNPTLIYPANGDAPYFELQEGSIAIDAGQNSIISSTGDIIPSTDIRGIGIVNSRKDIGAYEYNLSSGVNDIKVSIQYFSTKNGIELRGVNIGEKISVYGIAGNLMSSLKTTDSTVSITIPKGIYLVRVANHIAKVLVR